MTSTANNIPQQPAAEQPLTWTSGKVWGSEGLTHRTATEINGESWKFTVDSPSKGHWVARAWRDGDFALYREAKTMKDAKAQAQAHANYAATQTCAECRKIGGHTLDCGVYRQLAVAKDIERGTTLGLRAEVTEVQDSVITVLTDHKTDDDRPATRALTPALLEQLSPSEAQQLVAEMEETFPHLAEWKDRVNRVGAQFRKAAETMVTQMAPAAAEAADAVRSMAAAVTMVQAARERVQFRKDTCGCRTPLHTMRCGIGGQVRIIRQGVDA